MHENKMLKFLVDPKKVGWINAADQIRRLHMYRQIDEYFDWKLAYNLKYLTYADYIKWCNREKIITPVKPSNFFPVDGFVDWNTVEEVGD